MQVLKEEGTVHVCNKIQCVPDGMWKVENLSFPPPPFPVGSSVGEREERKIAGLSWVGG